MTCTLLPASLTAQHASRLRRPLLLQRPLGLPAGPQTSAANRSVRLFAELIADPDSAVIPGAVITLTPASGKPIIVNSGPDGTFLLRSVPAGTYSITITMQGFAGFVRQGVRITSAPVTINAKLAIQDEKTEVTVTANPNAVSVDPGSNSSATVINGRGPGGALR